MFTGIIEETGILRHTVISGISGTLTIGAKKVLKDTKVGDSIAVNGVCLTVTSLAPGAFTADVMAETLRCTNLGTLQLGARCNLERAMPAGGRFGGHIVAGHIDGTGVVRSMTKEGNAVRVTIDAPPEVMALIVEKGSIAVDGISLTVAGLDERSFQVGIIPHTGEETTLLSARPGDTVNLESDIVGKYVRRLLTVGAMDQAEDTKEAKNSGLSMEFLLENGF